MAEAQALADREPSEKEIRLVIGASSAGTIFEWYDFFIYGTLAYILKDAFYATDNETLGLLLVWSTFAVGFAFRPLGAVLFGLAVGVGELVRRRGVEELEVLWQGVASVLYGTSLFVIALWPLAYLSHALLAHVLLSDRWWSRWVRRR